MEEKLEKLRQRIEEVREAPVFLKLSRAEAALDDALELLTVIVEEVKQK